MKKAVAAGLAGIWLLQLTGCTNNADIKQGEKLSAQYCQSCHQLPGPELLDKKTWRNYVLPKMGGYLGFRRFQSQDYYQSRDNNKAMKVEDWAKLVR